MKYVKGGRGKRAPYKTTHCRVPEACKPLVEKLVAYYKSLVDNSEATASLLNSVSLSLDRSYEKLVDLEPRALDNKTFNSQYGDVKNSKE